MGTWDDSPAGSGLRSQHWELGMVSRASVRLTAALPWPHAAENEPIARPDVEVQRQREEEAGERSQEAVPSPSRFQTCSVRSHPLPPKKGNDKNGLHINNLACSHMCGGRAKVSMGLNSSKALHHPLC